MQSISNANFGPLIAYLIPGATVLFALSPYSSMLRTWFAAAPGGAPTIGGFLYLTIASLGAGMTVSAVRWAVIDSLLRILGVKLPPLDFGKLGSNVEAYALLIEIHYRHYLFYANMFVSVLIAYICYRTTLGGLLRLGWSDLGVLFLEIIFFATARDTLSKYYARGEQLLRDVRDHAR